MRKVFAFIVTLSIALVGCTPVVTTTINTNQGTQPAPQQATGAEESDRQVSPQVDAAAGGQSAGQASVTAWKSFDNRALGYTVKFPANWYWRHFIKQEIDREGVIDDYFAADPNQNINLGSEYVGRYVIEVSTRGVEELLSDFRAARSNITQRTRQIAGTSANFLEGVATDGQKQLVYVFSKNGKTYRILFTMQASTAADEEQFAAFVESIEFAE